MLKPLALAFVIATLACLLPVTAHAESCFEAGDVIVADGETLRCDLTILPGSLRVEEGGRIVGSANALVGSARILGEVTEDVAVLEDLIVGGRVGGDATVLKGSLTVEAGGDVAGNASASRDLTVEGRVRGDLTAGGDIVISDEDAVSSDANVTVGDALLDAEGEPLELDQATGAPPSEIASLLLLAAAMVVFGAVFAALATSAIPDAVANARAASLRSVALSTFFGLVAGLVILFSFWLVIPALIGLVAMAVGGVGLGERVGGRLAKDRSRVVQSAIGTGSLTLVAALLLVIGAGHPVRLCLAAVPLALLAGAALGPGLLTQFGRREWRSRSAQPSSPPSEDEAWIEPPRSDMDDDRGEVDFDEAAPPMPSQGEAGPPAADLPGAVPPVVAPPAFEGGAIEDAPDSVAEIRDSEGQSSEASQEDEIDRALSQLRRIPGITPIYAELLRAEGVASISDFADLSPQRLLEIVSTPGVMPIDLETAGRWQQAARELGDAE